MNSYSHPILRNRAYQIKEWLFQRNAIPKVYSASQTRPKSLFFNTLYLYCFFFSPLVINYHDFVVLSAPTLVYFMCTEGRLMLLMMRLLTNKKIDDGNNGYL
jgi:hypothetical protein